MTCRTSELHLAYLKRAQNNGIQSTLATEYTVGFQLFLFVLPGSPPLSSLMTEYHPAYQQPGRRANLKARFVQNEYHFHTIVKLKNHKLNLRKLVTFCSSVDVLQGI